MAAPVWNDSPQALLDDPMIIPRRKLSFEEYLHLNAAHHHLLPRQWFIIIALLPFICLHLFRVIQRWLSSGVADDSEPSSSSDPYATSSPVQLVYNAVTTFVRESSKPNSRVSRAICDLTSLAACLTLLVSADHFHVVGVEKRHYSRDLFMFLMLLLFAYSFAVPGRAFIPRKSQSGLLNRDQTEEWKGWMQVAFVWYHYFAASETYPAIRILIAAYVWQTGFGNFSYFWVTGDFSFVRVWKMNFRLNFLVTLLLLCMPRPYMLYYICPLHTLWFVVTYVGMAIAPRFHHTVPGAAVKLACAVAIVFLLWPPGVPYPTGQTDDWGAAPYVPALFDTVWTPLKPLLSFQGRGLYEWYFRTRLDCWIPMLGWVCAYYYPRADAWLAAMTGAVAHPPPDRPPASVSGVVDAKPGGGAMGSAGAGKPGEDAKGEGAKGGKRKASLKAEGGGGGGGDVETGDGEMKVQGSGSGVQRKGDGTIQGRAGSVASEKAGSSKPNSPSGVAIPTKGGGGDAADGGSGGGGVDSVGKGGSTSGGGGGSAAAIPPASLASKLGWGVAMFGVGCGMMLYWATNFWFPYVQARTTYNAWHPYISWIPVVGYMLARNCCAWARERYLWPLAAIGRITLETYLCQHHLYLANDAKTILVLVPGYPLVNFFVVTCVYVAVSHRLMNLTLLAQRKASPQSLNSALVATGEEFGVAIRTLSIVGAYLCAVATFVIAMHTSGLI